MKNWKSYIAVLLICAIGLFLSPQQPQACTKHAPATMAIPASCTSCHAHGGQAGDCCHKASQEKKDKGCQGACKGHSCHCANASIPHFGLQSPAALQVKNQFLLERKLHFFFLLADFSTGFYSIWIPPKIA